MATAKVVAAAKASPDADRTVLRDLRVAETVFDHSVGCLAILDRDFNFIHVNAAYAETCRKDISEFAGRNHFDLYPSNARGIFENVVRSKLPYKTFSRAFTFPDQPERGVTYWDWELVPVLDARGEMDYLVFSLIDVTERVRAEEASRESEKELRAIFESVLDGILVADAHTRSFLAANPTICRMLGYEHEELLGLGVTDIHPQQDLPHVLGLFDAMARHELQVAEDVPILRKDGSVAYADIKASAIRLRGRDCLLGIFGDVTKRRRAVDSALANETRLRLALSSINMAVFHQDLALRYTWMYQPQLGYMPEQVIGRTDAELLPAEAARRITELKRRVLETGETLRDEVPVTVKQGTFYYDLTAEPMRDARGTIVGVSGTTLDITERKRAESALRESEGRYRQLFEANPHPMWVFDEESLAFLAVNDAALSHYGWSREEFLRMTLPDIHPTEGKSALFTGLASDDGKDLRVVGSAKHRKKDGSVIDVEVRSHLVDFAGTRARVVAAFDVTDRKRFEDSLRAAEGQFRGLVEQSIAGIYILQDGRFAYLNPRFAEIYGYGSVEELIGREPEVLVSDTDQSMAARNFEKLLEGEVEHVDYQVKGLRKDGAVIHVGGHGARATYRGRLAIIGMLQDISEKMRADKQIRQSLAQLEAALKSTVEVATTLSEMRDPYTAGHERRVAQIAVAIGAELGFDSHRQEGLRVAGHLHDTGKMTVPSEILSKPGKLTAIEMQLIRGHARAGYDVLKTVEWPWPVAQIALQHHERMDGSGYPRGLKGEAILLEARIMAVADVIESMSTHRPYRPALGIEKALAEIERGRATLYDPDVVDAGLRLFRQKDFRLPA